MAVPIFTPDLDYAVSLDMSGIGMSWRMGQETFVNGRAPPIFPPSPSERSSEATRFWLNLSDFMQLPYVQHFQNTSDHSDLMRQLCWADFDSISAPMQARNDALMSEAVTFWQQHFLRVFSPVK